MAASVILRNAFGIGAENRIIGGPDWLFRDRYDVDARAEGVDRIPPGQLAPMLQHLLAERFNFRGRVEQRMLPVYALVEDPVYGVGRAARVEAGTEHRADRNPRSGQHRPAVSELMAASYSP
jgi:uncharacterized protein (TIGR03435 family)